MRDYNELQAKLAEIDGNLIQDELPPVQRVRLIKRREEIIDSLGLRAKSGGTSANQHKSRGAISAPLRTADLAKTSGMKKRRYQTHLQLGKNLGDDVLDVLTKTDATLGDLERISKIQKERQMGVAVKLASGEAKSVIVTRRMITQELVKNAPLLNADTRYRVIYADPPWRDGNISGVGAAENHYPTLSLDAICAFTVGGKTIKELAQDDAVLCLWVTNLMLLKSSKVIESWGFEYKSSIIWDKGTHGLGNYVNNQHEQLLICTKGSCMPEITRLPSSVQTIAPSGKHSEKPERFREIIDTLYPSSRRIELFARKTAAGWDAFGDEIPGVFQIWNESLSRHEVLPDSPPRDTGTTDVESQSTESLDDIAGDNAAAPVAPNGGGVEHALQSGTNVPLDDRVATTASSVAREGVTAQSVTPV